MPELVEIQQRRGVPPISQLSWIWAVAFSLLSSGLFMLGMAIHIARWVRERRKKGWAFYLYLPILGFILLALIPESSIPDVIDPEFYFLSLLGAAILLWFVATFFLRYELTRYYRSSRGNSLHFNPALTFVFTIFYLHYKLWRVRDTA